MTEASGSFAGNLTDQPEVRHAGAGIARASFRVAVPGRRTARRRSSPWWPGATGPSTPPIPVEGQAGRGGGPAPAAGMDG
jgi:hypothetical protein